jgi:hypothetical protein
MIHLDSEYDHALEMAYRSIMRHGTVILPTHVGYTVVALLSEDTSHDLDFITGISHEMSYNIIGSESTYRLIFDSEPPNIDSFGQLKDDLSISFVRRYSRNICPDLLQRLNDGNAISSNGECTFAINLGPVCEYMLQRFQSEDSDQILIGAHCVVKPKTKTYTLDAIDPEVKSKVDFILDIPHWSKPQFDDMDRWLSSPVFDLEELRFRILGKNMSIAAVVISIFTLSLFTSIDTEGGGAISWDEFKLYFSKFEISERGQMTDYKLRNVFKSIDRDGSGSIDINELYEHILRSANAQNAFVFGGDSSTMLIVAPPSFDEDEVKYHLQPERNEVSISKKSPYDNLSRLHTRRKTRDYRLQIQRQKNDYSNQRKKKVSSEETGCLSEVKVQNVFNHLYQLSSNRQKEGKALRHVTQCTSMKRAAKRNGGQYTCKQRNYHRMAMNENDVCDGKENFPHPKISLTQAEQLYDRLLHHKKKVEDKKMALMAQR